MAASSAAREATVEAVSAAINGTVCWDAHPGRVGAIGPAAPSGACRVSGCPSHRLGNEDDRCGLAGLRVDGFKSFPQPKPVRGKQGEPGVNRSEVPRRRINKVAAKPGPGAVSPAIDISRLTIRHKRMQRLHDKAPTRPEKRRHGSEQRLNHLVSKKRKVADSDIKPALQRAGQDGVVWRENELTTPGPTGLINEGRDHINPNCTGHPGCKLSHEPTLTATKIKDRVRRTAHHGINDRLIGYQDAALNLTVSNSGSPW